MACGWWRHGVDDGLGEGHVAWLIERVEFDAEGKMQRVKTTGRATQGGVRRECVCLCGYASHSSLDMCSCASIGMHTYIMVFGHM